MRSPVATGCVASLIIFLAACDQPTTAQDAPTATALAEGSSGAPTPSFDADTKAETPQQFWARFRGAVLSGDPSAVLPMVRFPFQTRGISDDDPVVTHDQAAFGALYSRILAQNAGDAEERTELQIIQSSAELPPEGTGDTPVQADATSFSVGSLEFKKIDNGWFWVFAYLNE